MKLSELRPCDHCRGSIVPFFYQVTVNIAVLDRAAVDQNLGMARFFAAGNQMSGSHLAIAEVMSSRPDVVKTDPQLETVVFLCAKCYTSKVLLPLALETAVKSSSAV